MIFSKTEVEGAYLIQGIPFTDSRGSFSRLYCRREFQDAGIGMEFVQMNLCMNLRKGTLRGLHYQTGSPEDKAVTCTRGRVFDVCVDVRRHSSTYRKYAAYELSEDNGCMLYIPKGCAHGYVTLDDSCQLLYLMSEFYTAGMDAGYRYDDPAFGIAWPVTDGLILSEKDRNLPYLNTNLGGNGHECM